MSEESDFRDLLENGPFIGGAGRITVERNAESPIEKLLFSGLSVACGVDEFQDFCKGYADQFGWHIYLQAGFPKLRRRVDAFAWPQSKAHTPVVIECDGFDYHSSKADMARDRERDRAFASLGYRVVRFTGSEIYQRPLSSSMALCGVLYPEMGR